ncbi:MAG: NAD(P)-dependent alcohol dehydrogenase [Promethearchaeota archaeon]
MKAIVYTRYGPPDVLQLKDVEKPTLKDSEVLIKVYSTVLNPSDCAFRKGDPFISRFFTGLRKPKNEIPGSEFAGEIEAIGKDVTLFKKGDQVFGTSVTGFGAHAEYICLPEEGVLLKKPANMTYEEAAALPDGGLGAFFFLEKANIQKGKKILINGASGAVGTFAIQLTKYYGAEVTGVCSTTNLELVKSLGADYVIDYTREDFTKNGQTYDIIFDVVAKSSFSHCKKSLRKRGIYIATYPSLSLILRMLWTSKLSKKKARFTAPGLKKTSEKIEALKYLMELIEVGKITLVMDRHYPLERIIEAHEYVDRGHKKGNVIIIVEKDENRDD